MSLTSGFFWIGFLILTGFYYAFDGKGQNRLLLIANVLFVLSLGWPWAALHFTVSTLAWWSGRSRTSPLWIWGGLILAPLIFFKLRIGFDSKTAIPVGLSFYTFQVLSYAFECRWRRTAPCSRLTDFWLFSSFFALMTMGPIERYSHLGSQFAKKREWDLSRLGEGFFLIALGFFKKLAVADVLYRPIQQMLQDRNSLHGIALAAFCVLGFFQMYADFSGYVDIARGCGKVLGLEISEGFRRPYLADGIMDVWHRWNITLITWLRDFVYMPVLLRSRNIYFASALVFILVGAWHNLNPSYLIWSGYWIFLSSLAIWTFQHKTNHAVAPVVAFLQRHKGLRIGSTFTLVCLGSLPFLSTNLVEFLQLFPRLFDLSNTDILTQLHCSKSEVMNLLVALAIMIVAETVFESWNRWPQVYLRWLVTGYALIFAAVVLGVSNARAFIYLQY